MADIAYIAKEDLQTYLNIALTPDGIAQFNLLQPLLQDVIDQYCNRTWNFTNPVVENFDALSKSGFALQANYSFFVKSPEISMTPANNAYPLAGGVQSVVIGNSPLDMNYVIAYPTFVKISASFPSVLLANPLGFKQVQITYSSDAAGNPPKALKLAFIMWMARLIQESPDAGKEVTRTQVGTVQAYYTPDKVPAMPNFVKLALDNYRLAAIDHL